MKPTKLLFIILFAVGFVATALGQGVKNSKYIKLNRNVINIYEQLDSMFPLRFLRNEDLTSGYYWVVYNFQTEKEANDFKPRLLEIEERLKAEPAYHQFTEKRDSAGQYLQSVVTDLKTDFLYQHDYLEYNFDNRRVYFFYSSRLQNKQLPLSPDQEVCDNLSALVKTYTSRHGAKANQVTFEGKTNYGFYTFVPGENAMTTNGTRYVIPNCNKADYLRFKNLIFSYCRERNVSTAANDLYGLYEECAIKVLDKDGKVLIVAAALKGSDLYIISIKGNIGVSLPRAWAEANPIYNR